MIESESLNMDYDGRTFSHRHADRDTDKFHIINGLGPGWTETPQFSKSYSLNPCPVTGETGTSQQCHVECGASISSAGAAYSIECQKQMDRTSQWTPKPRPAQSDGGKGAARARPFGRTEI